MLSIFAPPAVRALTAVLAGVKMGSPPGHCLPAAPLNATVSGLFHLEPDVVVRAGGVKMEAPNHPHLPAAHPNALCTLLIHSLACPSGYLSSRSQQVVPPANWPREVVLW